MPAPLPACLTRRFWHNGLVLFLHPWLVWGRPLTESDFAADPMLEFDKWYKLARRCFWSPFPDAVTLSTVDAQGHPEGRMVLLKSFDEKGFVFFTNYHSAKGQALSANPRAALTFYWEAVQRQVRVQGEVEKISAEESDAYFATRFRRTQLGAWASRQSEDLESRALLERRMFEFERKFKGQPVPRPAWWGGFRVKPAKIEFWKLRLNRLHDRFVYQRRADGGFDFKRLYP